MTPVAHAIRLGATPLGVDEHGVPRLLRADAPMPAQATDARTAARLHVARLSEAWGVKQATMPTLEALAEAPVAGGKIVRLRQVIDGMVVDPSSGGEVRVMMRGDGSLIAASGRLVSTDTPRPGNVRFLDDEAGAVARAVSTAYGVPVAAATLATRAEASDGSHMLGGTSGRINISLARAQQAWFPAGETLIPAWIVDAYASDVASTSGDAFRTVIAADDGRVLQRVNLTADAAFTYRVFAENTGELHPFDGPIADVTPNATGLPNTTAYPPYVLPNLVTVDGLNHPFTGGTADPWLAATRTETNGNNVSAYTDINAPDGLTFGDFRATLTGPATFDRTYDTGTGAITTQQQQMAGITSLFYLINWLHDFWYDAGFTEPTGNAQDNNLGRGGQDRDAMNAEAQDNALGGSRNNANMSTPADGIPPRMQVFIWDGKADRTLAVAGRNPPVGQAAFGPPVFDATGAVVVADDGVDTGSDGCTALTNDVAGKIVLVDRGGGCTFKRKTLNAQNGGAIGVLLANNVASVAPPGMGDDATITTPITIGILSILQTEGAQIKADIAAAGGSPVNATLHRGPAGPDLDGSLDATVIAHEFAHYLHHRLTACNTSLCGAQSEGWGDFDSLLVMARQGDNLDKAFPMATYSTASFAADPVYFGIRRAPYSTNQSINPLSFRHMSDGTPLPNTVPFNGGGANSEVHNSGEVWASTMWEGYVALQKAGATRGISFNDTRLKMRQYVVTGLLIAPPQATPTETRDAILIAARAVNTADHDTLAAAYARRGFGSCAISPPRDSVNFVGIVESNEVKGRLEPGALTSALTSTCDSDGVLDAGETSQVTLSVSNAGPVALADVSVALTTSIAGLTVTPPSIAIGALDAYSDTQVTFNVTLDSSVTAALASDLKVNVTASNGCANVSIPIIAPLNTDDKPASSANDNFDAVTSVWSPMGSPSVWSHVRESGLDAMWSGADPSFTSDASLVSPPITAGSGNLTITFSHRFGFEFTPPSGATPLQAFDGGVIEYSTDGGATWTDFGLIANPGYTTNLVTGGTNPLNGRRAYGANNPSFPSTDNITMFIGNRLAGKTFQMRFRAGSDSNGGGAGWQIDDVKFTGIVGTPFPTLVPDATRCPARPTGDPGTGQATGPSPGAADQSVPPSADTTAGCQVGGSGVGSGALLLALSVLVRRRRR
jgi:large repetitive protein